MAKPIESIFDECIQRIQQGESIESCLQSYPEVAPELQNMLTTFVNVNWRASLVQPDHNFKARARMQLQSAMYSIKQDQQIQQAKQIKKPTIFNLQRAWIPALICIFFLLFSSVGTAAAASNSMPDQPLYPIKLATEQVQLALSFSDNDKAMTNVRFVENRSQEIATMAAQGKTDQVITTTNRLLTNLEQTDVAIKKAAATEAKLIKPMEQPTTSAVKPTLPSSTNTTRPAIVNNAAKSRIAEAERLKNTVETTMSKNITALEAVLEKAPEKAKPSIRNAIEAARTKQEIFKQSLPATNKPPEGIKPDLRPNTTLPNNMVLPPKSTDTKGIIQTNPVTVNPPTTTDINKNTTGTTNTTTRPTINTTGTTTTNTSMNATIDKSTTTNTTINKSTTTTTNKTNSTLTTIQTDTEHD